VSEIYMGSLSPIPLPKEQKEAGKENPCVAGFD
jgi:hypothetical protein